MNKIILIIIAIVILIFGVLLFRSDNRTDYQAVEETPPLGMDKETFTLPDEGLTFAYQDGANGYHLEERAAGAPPLVREIILTPTSDYEDEQDRVGGEGSPSINVRVYENNLNQSPNVWINANPAASNIQIAKGDPLEAVIGGANAVEYEIDGLYPSHVVVIAHGGYIFIVTGEYLDESSMTYRDFDTFLNSFTFIQTEGQI